jgi:predicted ArsR family transcriptional regulator
MQPATEAGAVGGSDRTRDAVARLVLERGPQTAAALAELLGLSPAAIRRHLDCLVESGLLVEREPRVSDQRGRGRPARTFALTDAGRAEFPHAYDDLATTALRYLRDTGGEQAVVAFAEHRAEELAGLVGSAVDRSTRTTSKTTAETSVQGVQICQHHCPVAHVAAEFPELCEAETRAFERVLGTYVQRLATIAHGDGVCTTHVPIPPVSSSSISSPTPAPRSAGSTGRN